MSGSGVQAEAAGPLDNASAGAAKRREPALRLGTRGSPLALRQAALVAGAIDGEVETVVLRTAGDRGESGVPAPA